MIKHRLRGAINRRVGRKWEIYAWQHIFLGSIYVANINPHATFDLLYNNTKIEIKSSKLYKRERGKCFIFWIRQNKTCDYFLLIGYRYASDKHPMKIYLMPAHLINHRIKFFIGPNHTGKWAEYEIPVGGAYNAKMCMSECK